MIAKMKSNLSAKETLLYNDKEKSEVIFINNLTGETWQEVEKQMAARQKLFTGRAKNLTAHIIISPSIEDGKRQTRLDWKEIGNSFLQKAGLSTNQSIAYLHKDKEHFHLHIVANRIDANGKIYRNGNELAMSQRIGYEIATERGLKRAADIMQEKKQARKNGMVIDGASGSVAQIRAVMTQAALKAWSDGKFDQSKYFNEIKSNGYEVRLFFKKDNENKITDEVRGYAIGKKDEHFLNASQIDTEFTLRRLKHEIPLRSNQSSANTESFVEPIKKDLEGCFQKALSSQKKFDPQLFLNEVRSKGYPVKEYFNKDTGKLRGYGIEKEDGGIINASEMGSEFTLANLLKRFNESNSFVDPSKKNTQKETNEPRVVADEFHSDPSERISKDFKHTVDISLIASDLKNLTSGHKYRSHQDFIKAVEEQGYHVHLRYDKGSLAGYTVHKGTEHYHDNEIDNGRYSLNQLTKNGMFFPRGLTNSPEIKEIKIQTFEDEFLDQNKIASKNQPIDLTNQLFVEREAQKKNESDKERIRKIVAGELIAHLRTVKSNGQQFDMEKLFSSLGADGYEVTRHFNKETGSLRGYSLMKYGFGFHASEIGREFTLSYLGGTHPKNKNSERGLHNKPRIIL